MYVRVCRLSNQRKLVVYYVMYLKMYIKNGTKSDFTIKIAQCVLTETECFAYSQYTFFFSKTPLLPEFEALTLRFDHKLMKIT